MLRREFVTRVRRIACVQALIIVKKSMLTFFDFLLKTTFARLEVFIIVQANNARKPSQKITDYGQKSAFIQIKQYIKAPAPCRGFSKKKI